jgi:hypothetical protein
MPRFLIVWIIGLLLAVALIVGIYRACHRAIESNSNYYDQFEPGRQR